MPPPTRLSTRRCVAVHTGRPRLLHVPLPSRPRRTPHAARACVCARAPPRPASCALRSGQRRVHRLLRAAPRRHSRARAGRPLWPLRAHQGHRRQAVARGRLRLQYVGGARHHHAPPRDGTARAHGRGSAAFPSPGWRGGLILRARSSRPDRAALHLCRGGPSRPTADPLLNTRGGMLSHRALSAALGNL